MHQFFRPLQLSLTIAGLCAACGAYAAERSEYATSGDWKILVDPDLGNGCLIQRAQENGTLIELGNVPNSDGGFFAAYHTDWTHLKAGQPFQIEFHFDETGFGGQAIVVERDGVPGGYAFFNNMALIDEFARRNTARVLGPRGGEEEISLKGTSKAVAAMRECQEKQTTASQ